MSCTKLFFIKFATNLPNGSLIINEKTNCMFSFFKSKKNNPITTKSTYYIRESIIHNIDDLIKVLLPPIEGNSIEGKTTEEIKFKNIPLLNLSQKQIISEMDEPIFIFDNSDVIPGHKVMFYKEDVEFYRFLVQFHFINDEFFFVSNKVSSSGMLSEKEKCKIIDQLKHKYLSKSEVENNNFLLRLTDNNGSILTTQDEVYFYVNYLSGNSIKNKLINLYSDSPKTGTTETNFEDTIDKYF